MVARGELAQELLEVRQLVKYTLNNPDVIHPSTTHVASGSPGGLDAVSPFGPPTTFPSEQAPAPNSDQEVMATLDSVGPFARPFLAVVMNPTAAGPHTLIALRSLHRLLARGSLEASSSSSSDGTLPFHQGPFLTHLEPLTRGVLQCKFEQTDAGADEAVEMAIADLLALLVQMDRRAIEPNTLMDAFNTVFVTRNTFVHSPALCYHFEDVLMSMVKAIFSDLEHLRDYSATIILSFLVDQLLHTPFIGGVNDDEAARDAQLAHDANRILCLKLSRCALRKGFSHVSEDMLLAASPIDGEHRSLLQIVQDDLCLSLLLTGQAIWADPETNSSGFISLEVLSEICSTMATLWTTIALRKHLVPQFEAIFTGFYQRALVLLRKRVNPHDSDSFHANLIFDAGIEIIMESLVDIFCLHDHTMTVAQGNGGSLESLFATYDCHVKRSDVAVGLMVELCRCAGSQVNEEGDVLEMTLPSEEGAAHGGPTPANSAIGDSNNASSSAPPIPEIQASKSHDTDADESFNTVDAWRQVPPHLKELCAEAIMGGMKCLFEDDHASEETKIERKDRKTILQKHVEVSPSSLSDINLAIQGSHVLRSIKSKKRLMRKAAVLFNKKSSKGIEFLLKSGVIPDPVTPRSVASFLRNGIVVGLDKKEVGAYLGEVGKSPQAGKSPPDWERDWFHKEVLSTYCSLFRFEGQSLLDGLRMFLAAFRLPGEAQQIDRILQAFSDSCGQKCNEGPNGAANLFSDDPKKASDAAYLLSFSIIMLNTDQHNDNIREDRKMTKDDFIKNNTDYGRDITDPGKELPPEYLESIYHSIREEEIRTEGEGADGCMTVERWKDVLRGSADDDDYQSDLHPTEHDAEDLTELVLEHVYMPIMSAIKSLWGWNSGEDSMEMMSQNEVGTSGMLGAQGARLGMDMALDMLLGVRKLGRTDIFQSIFNTVTKYTGLLEYTSNAADRTWSFSHSVEAQSALVVALRIARESSDQVGVEGWMRIWSMLAELRDLKVLGGGVANRDKSILMESDPDLLTKEARREWSMKIVKGSAESEETPKKGAVKSIFGSVGRALFGSVEEPDIDDVSENQPTMDVIRTIHGKEDHKIWDELAPSDDEDELSRADSDDDDDDDGFTLGHESRMSLGAKFESQLIHEDLLINQQREMHVTGLEREDEDGPYFSPRARVRHRLGKACDFASILSECRFMSDEGIGNMIQALVALIPNPPVQMGEGNSPTPTQELPKTSAFPISPASEAFAEVLIAEIALRNRDRLGLLWQNYLSSHYTERLQTLLSMSAENEKAHLTMINGGLEKAVTGLIRISCFTAQRGELVDEVLSTWRILDSVEETDTKRPLLNILDKHIAEGIWRTARYIDGSSKLSTQGWDGLMSLVQWCANRGGQLPPVRSSLIGSTVGLPEDDPAFQTYRSLHFMLTASEVRMDVPPYAVRSIRALIAAGERRNAPKLSIGALDLLHEVNNMVEVSAPQEDIQDYEDIAESYWKTAWRPVLDCMAEACEHSRYPVSFAAIILWLLPRIYLHLIFRSFSMYVHNISERSTACLINVDGFLSRQACRPHSRQTSIKRPLRALYPLGRSPRARFANRRHRRLPELRRAYD